MVEHLKYLALAVAAVPVLAVAPGGAAPAMPRVASPPVPLASCAPGAAPASALQTPKRAAKIPAGAQVRHFPAQDLTFSTATTAEGDVRLEGTGGEFTFRKTVRANGAYSLELETSRDRVVIGGDEGTITVTRGRKHIALTAETAGARVDDVRRLLADSKAVQLLRSAGARFDASDEDSAASVAVLVSDAMVGALTGDIGAPRRVARRLARAASARLRPVGGRPDTCYYRWEEAVLWAYMDFEQCWIIDQWWIYWCSLRWNMQVESAWFSFLACSGLGLDSF